MNICVITADLYKSREIPDRSKVQEKLKIAIKKINKKYKDYILKSRNFNNLGQSPIRGQSQLLIILSDFMITLGDEWQGALKNLEKSYEIISEFQAELFPARIAFGVGEGNISTKISRKVTEMDGQAFINSREALEKSKKERRNITYIIKNKEKEEILNIVTELIQTIKNDWTTKQFKKIKLYKELKTTRKVAERLKMDHSDIVRTLNSAKYYEITNAEEFINLILKDNGD